MKRYNHNGFDVLTESDDGEWVKFSDIPKLDKPAALLALIEYAKLGIECYGQAVAAIEKLSAEIIAEVNELKK